MVRGTVTYYSSIPRLTFERFQINPGCPDVELLELELAEDYVLQLVVHTSHVVSQDDGIHKSEVAVEKVLNRLAYTLGAHVADASFIKATFEDVSGLGPPITIHRPAGFVAACVVSHGGQNFLTKVKTALEKPVRVGERHFGLFRSAMKTENPGERFLSLYHILLLLYND